MFRHPEVLWAQRSSTTAPEKNIIYLTVNLPDILPSTLTYDLTPTSLSFKATAGSAERIEYAFDLEFFAEVDIEQSTKRITSRSLIAVLRKKESQSEYWPRLTKEKLKTPFIKTDFSKWVDEDEQDGNTNIDDELGGFPGMDDGMGGMGGMGMGGMGGMGGMDFSKMMAQAGSNFGAGSSTSAKDDEAAESESDSEDGPPPLEEPEHPQ